jgi:hypothetical protein
MYMLSTQPDPSPLPVTHCINTYLCTYSHREVGKGGGGQTSEKARRALAHKWGRKYQHLQFILNINKDGI